MVNQGSYDLRRDVDKLMNTVQNGNINAVSYFILTNTPVVVQNNNTFSPTSIKFETYRRVGDAVDLFDCTIKLYGSTNGINETYLQTSSGHSLTYNMPSNTSYTHFKAKLLVDDVVQDYQTVRVVNTDSLIVFLGNESQLIPCDNDGNLISSFSFNVPVYCYNGVNKYPATFNSNDSNIPSWVTYTNTNPTSSNAGNMAFTVNSTPTHNTGYFVLAFDVNGETIYCILSYARTNNGADGDDGIDGDGYHYIFYRTQSNTVPTTPVAGVTPIIDNKTTPEINISPYSWYEESVGASPDYPYEWMSMRIFDGENQRWGAFSTPMIWDDYTVNGKKGDTGDDGVRGADGTLMTGEEIVDKINLLKDASDPIGFSTSSNFVPSIVKKHTHDTTDTSSWRSFIDSTNHGDVTVIRQGDIVTVAINNVYVKPAQMTGEMDGWTRLGYLDGWACPPSEIYFPAVFGNGTRFKVVPTDVNTNIVPELQIWLPSSIVGNNTTINFSGSTTYPADTEFEATYCSINYNIPAQSGYTAPTTSGMAHTIRQGTSLKIDLSYTFRKFPCLSQSGTSGVYNGTVFVKLDDKIMQKKATNGRISVDIDYGSGNHTLSVWHDGYVYTDGYPSTLSTATNSWGRSHQNWTINILPSSGSAEVTFHHSTDYYIKVYDSESNLFRHKDISIEINGIKYDAQTDSKGEYHYNLEGYTGIVTVSVTVKNDTRHTNYLTANTFTHTYNLDGTNQILKLTPTSVSGTGWTNIDMDNLKNKNDGLYIKTNTIQSNSSTNSLDVSFGDIPIPTSATVENISLNMNYGSLYGSTHLSRPICYCNDEIHILSVDNDYITSFDFNTTINQKDCGIWRAFSDTDELDESNTDEIFNNIVVMLPSIDFESEGDSGAFAIDFIELEIEYSI